MESFRIPFVLLVLCLRVLAEFPAAGPSPFEDFSGGGFDLDHKQVTFIPYSTGTGETHYRYSVRPIRELEVDLSEVESWIPTEGRTIPGRGIPFRGFPQQTLQIPDGFFGLEPMRFQFTKENGDPCGTLDFFGNSSVLSFVDVETTILESADKTTIQYHIYEGNGSIRYEFRETTVQLEFFLNGMIRISYLGADSEEVSVVGIRKEGVAGAGSDLSASSLVVEQEIVAGEGESSSSLVIALPQTQAGNFGFEYAARDRSALRGYDFGLAAGSAAISGGTLSTSLPLNLADDLLPETEESFSVEIRAPGVPDWIYGESEVWILDNEAPAAALAPIITSEGNRIIIQPPPGSGGAGGMFRILSIQGGGLALPGNGAAIGAGAEITLAAGAVGLIASDPGVLLKVAYVSSPGAPPLGTTAYTPGGTATVPILGFKQEVWEATEGESVRLLVEASQTGVSAGYEVIPVSAHGFTNGSGDYLQAPRPLDFRSGTAVIEVSILADDIEEPVEEFWVRLVDPSPNAYIGRISLARVKISDGTGVVVSPGLQRLSGYETTDRVFSVAPDGSQPPSKAWRFGNESAWRGPDEKVRNVRDGLHFIEFLDAPADKPFLAHDSYVNEGIFTSQLRVLKEREAKYRYFDVVTPDGTGQLQAVLTVGANQPAGSGQWRRRGESVWRNSANIESTVPAGYHVVEFRDSQPGTFAPPEQAVLVTSGTLNSISAEYENQPASGVSPLLVPDPDVRTSGATWSHVPIQSGEGKFVVSFDFRPDPAAGGLDTLVGLSATKATAYPQLSAILRARTAGFDGWKNSTVSFAADQPLPVVGGKWHFVKFSVNTGTGRYDLTVTDPSGVEVPVLTNAEFRSPAASIQYLSMVSVTGSHAIRNVRFSHEPDPIWTVMPIAKQKDSFAVSMTLADAPAYFNSGGTGGTCYLTLGVSNGRTDSPVQLPEISYTQKAGNTTIGHAEVVLEVDLISQHYVITVDGVTMGDGSLPSPLTEADHFYVAGSYFGPSSFTLTPLGGSSAVYSITRVELPPAVSKPSGPGVNDPSHWTHIPLPPQTGRFALDLEVEVLEQTVGSGPLVDGVVALSSGKIAIWDEYSVAVRAVLPTGGTGLWDVRSGGVFTRSGDLPVVSGGLYHVELEVDVPGQTFKATLTGPDGNEVVVAESAGFRFAANELRYLTLRNVQGRFLVKNVGVPRTTKADAGLEAPYRLTGRVITPLGSGSGVAVAEHAVLTTARLVFDTETYSFAADVDWYLANGGRDEVPELNEPSNIVLTTGYAAVLLASSPPGTSADAMDLAVLSFRPLDLPYHNNSPGRGGFSGFHVDGGDASWSFMEVERFLPSFPVAGVPREARGKIHSSDLSTVPFGPAGPSIRSANNLNAPRGSEGAPVFTRQPDGLLLPAAICLGETAGVPRFRSIDATAARAIHMANDFPGHLKISQTLSKGGYAYIPTSLARQVSSNRIHILSDAIPSAATWKVRRTGYAETFPARGGKTVSADPGIYTILFEEPPPGYDRVIETTTVKALVAGKRHSLPKAYVPSSYTKWLQQHFTVNEMAKSSISAPQVARWPGGVSNLVAYAFGFDPNSTKTRRADPVNWIPGYPLVDVDHTTVPPTFQIEFLRRVDPDLTYAIQHGDSLGSWTSLSTAPVVVSKRDGWEHVRWNLAGLTSPAGRKFVRTRVVLAD